MRQGFGFGTAACVALACGGAGEDGRSSAGAQGLGSVGTQDDGGTGEDAGASDDGGDGADDAAGAASGLLFDVGSADDGTTAELLCPPPELLIVLDRSFSMRQLPSGGDAEGQIAKTKWAHAVAAVEAFAVTYEASIEVGLGLFPSPVDTDYCVKMADIAAAEVPDLLCDVGPGADPAPGNAATIDAMLDAETTRLCRGTPIDAALKHAGQVLAAGDADERNVVLVTDGKEKCDGDPVMQAKLLAQSDVRVFAIGFGDTMSDPVGHETLNAIACAGRTAADFANTCMDDGLGNYDPVDPTGAALYIAVEDGDALAAAFEEQIAGALCCGSACPPG